MRDPRLSLRGALSRVEGRRSNPVDKRYYVYIATNKRNTVLYAGVTNNINRRMHEHRYKLVRGFSARYNVIKLVYYEAFSTALEAIVAEKKIKAGSRQKKMNLIQAENPSYRDLLAEIASRSLPRAKSRGSQ